VLNRAGPEGAGPDGTRPNGPAASWLPGPCLLGERAALAGLSRQAPRSVGGAFRALRAADGWLGLSLVRPDDFDLLPALADTELAGAYAAAAVAGALLSPRGQLLDVSMYDVAVAATGAPGHDAAVVATGAGTWAVSTGNGITPVCQPGARRPRSAAARLGQHTRSVVDGVGGGARARGERSREGGERR
jgi:hypothetical protein